MPSVTNRSFGEMDAGDSFGYAGQGGYGENLKMGGYAGVGPKDRWRADWRIEEDMHERLTGADTIDASAVIVAVTEGHVTLSGWVPERSMKHDAEEIAHRVAGVCESTTTSASAAPARLRASGEAVRSGHDQQAALLEFDRVSMDDAAQRYGAQAWRIRRPER
jgi:hypothetical protein